MKDRINKIKSYFKGFRVDDNVEYICVSFPDNWVVSEEMCEDNVSIEKDGKKKIYFLYSELDNGYDIIFDSVDNIISLNKELEEKTILLKAKAEELKELFENESLERLRTLEFTFKNPINLTLTNKSKKNKVKEELEVKEEPEVKIETKEVTITKEDIEKDNEAESGNGVLALARKIADE